jgi:hypothetical protein
VAGLSGNAALTIAMGALVDLGVFGNRIDRDLWSSKESVRQSEHHVQRPGSLVSRSRRQAPRGIQIVSKRCSRSPGDAFTRPIDHHRDRR